jgi:hypothetical protein
MAKEDFCFTYYDGDAARDKAHMNRLERGAYDDIISAQRKKGNLTIDDLKKVLGLDFETCFPALEWILIKDEDEKYFIEWLANSLQKSKSHSKKQKANIAKRWDKSLEIIPNEYQSEDLVIPNEYQTTTLVIPLEDGDGYVFSNIIIEKEKRKISEIKEMFSVDSGLIFNWLQKGFEKSKYENGIDLFLALKTGETYQDFTKLRTNFIYWMPNYDKAAASVVKVMPQNDLQKEHNAKIKKYG